MMPRQQQQQQQQVVHHELLEWYVNTKRTVSMKHLRAF
jgi:hypothetical protein